MPLPKRRKAPPQRSQEPPREVYEDTSAPDADEIVNSASDWMTTGEDADKRINDYQKEVSKPRAREFFITTKEVNDAQGRATVRAHFALNYADPDYRIAVPRITIKEGGNFNSYTSPPGDCALAAGGQRPSVRPVYLLIDHRTYTTRDGKEGGDDVRLWIPMPSVQGLVDQAIDDLCETLGKERDTLNLTEYEAKITKAGTGRRSTWAVSFIARSKPLPMAVQEKIGKFFRNESGKLPTMSQYKTHMREVLAPDPRYLLSRGAKPYVEAQVPVDAGKAGDEEPPY